MMTYYRWAHIKLFMCVILFNPHKVGIIIIYILQMRKLRLSEVR